MGALDGKVAIVTGAGRGIGRGEALLLASEGAKVVVNDLGGAREGEGADKTPAQEVADEIVSGGGEAVANYDDVASWPGAESLIGQAVDAFGKLDILVNNAAIIGLEGIMETSVELWDRVIAVNQTGTFLGMRAAIPAMRRAGGGSIVNISSVLATMGSGNSASYTASKGAVTALTRTVSVELATEGIRVNAVHPGGVETPMAVECLGDDAEARRALVATHPMGRIGEPGEIANGVLFLASDEASFVTGASLVIDGGNTVW
jgi:cyclopentanol dehydrogenase